MASHQLGDDAGRILLVEDSPTDRLLVERLFRDRLIVACDADTALEAVRRQSFAAILLAQSLPRRSGLEMLHDLRAASDTTPIVLMTEGEDESIRRAAFDAGASACVVKQIGFERELVAVVDRSADLARAVSETLGLDGRTDNPDRHRVEILVFEIAGQRHGLLATDVEAVSRAVTISAVPAAPPGIEGCIEYRGNLVPVVDLRGRLGLAPKALEESEHLIVFRAEGRTLAVRADRVIALVPIETNRLQPSPELTGARIAAVARLADGPVFMDEFRAVASGRDVSTAEQSPPVSGAPT